MAVSERVIVELEARLGRYEANVATAERKFTAAMGGIQNSATRTEGLVARAMGGISGALAGVSAVALARTFLDIADTSKTLEAQLRLATNGFGTFAKAQEDVRRIAAETRSGLEETASLYGNFARGAKELGADQEAAARATETFSKTLKISGADANQASSATLQFGQALAAGALRGDELNSILEASPRLARLLAESLGMPIGAIKQLGEDGKLTSDKLLNALTNTKFTAGIDAEFRQMPVTFDEAMTQVENAAIVTFGAFDRGGQFSTALANFITQGTDGFAELEQSAEDFGVSARANIEGLASAFAPVFSEAERLFSYLNSGFQGVDIGRDIQASLDQIDAATKSLSGGESRVEQWINKRLWGRESGGTNFGGRFRQARAASEGQRRSQMAAEDARNRQAPARSSAPRPTAASSGDEKKKADAARRKAEAAARKAEREREQAIRDEASSARESAQLQDDITAAKAAMAVATRDILQFNLDQIESERQQRKAAYETQRKLGDLSAKELADRTAAVDEIADLQRQRAFQIADENERRDRSAVAQAGSQNQQDLYRAQADLTASREERHAIELRLVELAYEQEQAELEAVLASQTATQAQKDIAAARLAILGQLQANDKALVGRQNESPLERYRRDLNSPDRANDEVENAVIDELEDVRDSISSAVQKTLGIKNPILAALLNSFIEQQLIRPILDSISGAAGGGGGIIGSLISAGSSFFGGGRAIGGPVRAGVAYDVGENGRERFIPQQAGVIVPNHALKGGGGAQTVIVKVQANDYFDARVDQRAASVATPIARQHSAQAGQAAYGQSMRDAPGAVRRAQRFRTT